MTKVIIDSFDTQEQAVAFTNWLVTRFKNGVPKLMCVKEDYLVEFDGIDTANTNTQQIVINIAVSIVE